MPSRVRKAYWLIFGRDPIDAELAAGIAYISQEPMRAYEERKAEAATERPDGKKPAADETDETPADPMPDGMMAGVTPGAGKKDEKLKLLPITAFGRYMKVLLSSNEFLFID
jgi:hypothetical protein